MNKLMRAGVVSAALLGSVIGMPAAVDAKAVAPILSSVEHAQAVKLAEQIVAAVTGAQAAGRGLPSDQAKQKIQLAVQATIRNSGATPTVADAALDLARAKLAAAGALECIRPSDDEQTCSPAGAALASISTLLKGIIAMAPASTNSSPGVIAISAPLSLAPPNSGSADRSNPTPTPPTPPVVIPPSVTPPVVTPPVVTPPPVVPPVTPPTTVTTQTPGSSDYRGS